MVQPGPLIKKKYLYLEILKNFCCNLSKCLALIGTKNLRFLGRQLFEPLGGTVIIAITDVTKLTLIYAAGGVYNIRNFAQV